MKKEYYVFVLQKDKKYVYEVISYLVGEDSRTADKNDFLEERGILSAALSPEDATVLKLKFPQVTLMPVGDVLDMIGQLSPTLKSSMIKGYDTTDEEEYEEYDDYPEYDDFDEDGD